MSTLEKTDTIARVFQMTAAAYDDRLALSSADGTTEWTWTEYRDLVQRCAAGLDALGCRRGDTIACWLGNRPEFHVADVAAAHLGVASFSVYPTYTAEQAAHVVADGGARVLVTESAFLEKALSVRAAAGTALETVICVDGGDATTLTWDEALQCGGPDFDLGAHAAAVSPDDLLTLIYTSGTTGAPKGVQLTHANVAAQVEALSDRLELSGGMRAVSWLPMAHIAERLCTHYLALAHGWQVTTCSDPRAVTAVLRQVKPEIFFSPPRLWEKLRASVLARYGEDARAVRGERESVLQDLGLESVRVAIVGAAPCPAEVLEFWHALGIQLGEVYGMSETTGVATVNPAGAIKIGTVGTPLNGVEVRLGDRDEVLVRGPVVMAGYRNLPDQTAEAIDSEGWLHTGDVGCFDEAGYLRIVDRLKEIIINAAGKNMSPANIEATLKAASPLIGIAVCIGEGRPYNTALIVPDQDVAAGRGPEDPRIIALVQEAVERANASLARVEQIKRFRIVDGEWSAGGDELTPTMKLKRRPISEKYATAIEELYR